MQFSFRDLSDEALIDMFVWYRYVLDELLDRAKIARRMGITEEQYDQLEQRAMAYVRTHPKLRPQLPPAKHGFQVYRHE